MIARRAAADAVAHLSTRHQRRAVPPAVNTAVYARFGELAEMMAPSHDEFEAVTAFWGSSLATSSQP